VVRLRSRVMELDVDQARNWYWPDVLKPHVTIFWHLTRNKKDLRHMTEVKGSPMVDWNGYSKLDLGFGA